MAAGERITFCRPQDAGGERVGVDFDKFSALVTERSQIVIGDGVPRFTVDEIDEGDVVVHAVSPGPLSPRKGINVTYARPELPAITDKDVADLEVAAEVGADFVALSFVRSAADLQELRERLEALGSKAKLVAKIEKIEAYEHLDEILAVTDGVMVARGDYGVEAGVARVPLMQKDTIQRATQAGKFVITATQMLESMIHAPEPTRAEAADVANAVIDGTSAVMLSAETSVGEYPLETVRAMAEIAKAAEESPVIHGRARDVAAANTGEAVMHAAVELARRARRRGAGHPHGHRRGSAGMRQVPAQAPDHRAVAPARGGQPAQLGMGRLPDAHAGRRERRRPDRPLARAGARLRRPRAGRVRRDHRGPPHRHAGRDEPGHGARDPLTVSGSRGGSAAAPAAPSPA